MFKDFEDIVEKTEEEGLFYFLLDYSDPSEISDEADEKCLKFKKLWNKILPHLREMEEMLEDTDQDFDIDD